MQTYSWVRTTSFNSHLSELMVKFLLLSKILGFRTKQLGITFCLEGLLMKLSMLTPLLHVNLKEIYLSCLLVTKPRSVRKVLIYLADKKQEYHLLEQSILIKTLF